MHGRRLCVIYKIVFLLCLIAFVTPSVALTGLKESLLGLTGGLRSKVVYVGTGYRLFAFDTEESTPRILAQGVSQQRSLISNDGQQVVFNKNKNVCAVNWDGTGERVLGPGKTADIWYDKNAKIEWVYCFIDWEKPIRRIRLDNPSIGEDLCTGKGGADWLTVHQSGTKYITNRTIYTNSGCAADNKGYGCWHTYSPDPADPDRILALQGGHRHVRLHPDDVYMPINPGVDEVWEVRWSNNKRFITFTSMRSCWAIRLSPDLHSVEETLQLTDGDGSCSPKLWVDPGCEQELSITRDPADVVAEDGKRSGFVAVTRTCGATFKWFRNGTEIPGATASSLYFDSTAVSDNGSRFSCEIAAAGKTLRSREATLTVVPDTTPPHVTAISNFGNSMCIMYSERVNSAAAEKANYTISPNVTVSSAYAQVSDYRVGHNASITDRDTNVYTITIANVTDMSSRHNRTSPSPLVIKFTGKGIIDKEPPSVPANVSLVSVTTRMVTLTWQPSRDNILMKGYQVLRNGTAVGTSLNGLLSYADTGLTRNTSYEYTVKALDNAGNLSAASTPLKVTTANPVYSLSSPKAGETYAVGTKIPIRYEVDRSRFSGELIIAISFNGGQRWFELSDQGFTPAKDTGTVMWTIPNALVETPTVSNTCRMQIYDYARTLDPFVMDGTFSIKHPASVQIDVAHRNSRLGVIARAGAIDITTPSVGRFGLRIYRLDGSRVYSAILEGKTLYRLASPEVASGAKLVEIVDPTTLNVHLRACIPAP